MTESAALRGSYAVGSISSSVKPGRLSTLSSASSVILLSVEYR